MRDISKRRYIMAFILTAAIFFLGFFFGFLMDLQRTDYFQATNEQNKLNIQSLQLQNELVQEGLAEDQCQGFSFLFDKAILELERNRERIEIYSQQANVAQEDFLYLKRQYTISQLNFFLLSKHMEESCPQAADYVRILYFYSNDKKCPECAEQANVLNYYKRQLKENILIFALDEEFEAEPTITLLKQTYNITEFPSIVVEDTAFRKFVGQDEIKDIICGELKESYKNELCQA